MAGVIVWHFQIQEERCSGFSLSLSLSLITHSAEGICHIMKKGPVGKEQRLSAQASKEPQE
jgi:hypothetical protein